MATFRWKPDGYGSIDESVRATGKSQVVEYRGVPVDDHWVPRPHFGDWDRFARAPTLSPLENGS